VVLYELNLCIIWFTAIGLYCTMFKDIHKIKGIVTQTHDWIYSLFLLSNVCWLLSYYYKLSWLFSYTIQYWYYHALNKSTVVFLCINLLFTFVVLDEQLFMFRSRSVATCFELRETITICWRCGINMTDWFIYIAI